MHSRSPTLPQTSRHGNKEARQAEVSPATLLGGIEYAVTWRGLDPAVEVNYDDTYGLWPIAYDLLPVASVRLLRSFKRHPMFGTFTGLSSFRLP